VPLGTTKEIEEVEEVKGVDVVEVDVVGNKDSGILLDDGLGRISPNCDDKGDSQGEDSVDD
jgi:hypothetical protein